MQPLGLHRRRARTLVALSAAFVEGEWKEALELPGVGRYAADAHTIFCLGRYKEMEPQDHALKWYVEWLRGLDEAERGFQLEAAASRTGYSQES